MHEGEQVEPAHPAGEHASVAPGKQLPFESQTEAAASVPDVQAALLQTPPAWEWQATSSDPLQVVVHDEEDEVQGGRVPWGAPVTATHFPSAPDVLHAEHWPTHALSQQTPSTQWPELQVASAVQITPFA